MVIVYRMNLVHTVTWSQYNAECKIAVSLRDGFFIIAKGDTFILHFAFII